MDSPCNSKRKKTESARRMMFLSTSNKSLEQKWQSVLEREITVCEFEKPDFLIFFLIEMFHKFQPTVAPAAWIMNVKRFLIGKRQILP